MDSEIKKEYEISFLLTSPDAEKELTAVLKSNKAEIYFQKPATELKLAYKIKRHSAALFGFAQFRAEPALIKPIDETLRLNTGVIRFMIMTPPMKAATSSVAPSQPMTTRPERKPATPALSNEALSEKLEEILK